MSIVAARRAQALTPADCASDCREQRDKKHGKCDELPEAVRDKCKENANKQYDKCIERCNNASTGE